MRRKKNPQECFEQIEELRLGATRRSGHSEYGGRVMPVLRLYKNLSGYEEKKAFQDALEMLLKDDDDDRRSFGVDVCLGFFVFRDAI
jgi:hypothetical protein